MEFSYTINKTSQLECALWKNFSQYDQPNSQTNGQRNDQQNDIIYVPTSVDY